MHGEGLHGALALAASEHWRSFRYGNFLTGACLGTGVCGTREVLCLGIRNSVRQGIRVVVKLDMSSEYRGKGSSSIMS